MDPAMRTALLAIGLFFVLVFGGMTAYVALEHGFDIFSLAALLILVMIGLALGGAISQRPEE
jgi:hypothetical protein